MVRPTRGAGRVLSYCSSVARMRQSRCLRELLVDDETATPCLREAAAAHDFFGQRWTERPSWPDLLPCGPATVLVSDPVWSPGRGLAGGVAPWVALRRRLRLPLPLAHGGCGGDGFTGCGAERPSRTPRPFAGAGLGAGHARGFGACGPGCPAAKACEHLCAGCCSGRSTSLRCLIDGLPGRGAEDCARGTRSYHGTCRGKAGASKRISKQDLVSGCCCSRVAPSCQYLLRMLASGGHTPFSSSASVSDALAL